MKLKNVIPIIFLVNLILFFLLYCIDEGNQGFVWLKDTYAILEYLGFAATTTGIGIGYYLLLRKIGSKIAIVLASIFSVFTLIIPFMIMAVFVHL